MSLTAITGARVFYLEGTEVHGDITPVHGDLAIYTYAPAGGFLGQEYSYATTTGWFERTTVSVGSDGSAAGSVVVATRSIATTLETFTAAATGTAVTMTGVTASFQATSDAATHSGTTIVNIEVSNDGVAYFILGTISVTDTSDTDGFPLLAPYKYARAKVDTGNYGTGGSVIVTMVES